MTKTNKLYKLKHNNSCVSSNGYKWCGACRRKLEIHKERKAFDNMMKTTIAWNQSYTI